MIEIGLIKDWSVEANLGVATLTEANLAVSTFLPPAVSILIR